MAQIMERKAFFRLSVIEDTDILATPLQSVPEIKVKVQWNILEKDTVDEIIFRTAKLRDRLLLELMARGAMRIGEVFKLTPNDIAERKLLLKESKSGRDAEIEFIPQKVTDRLREYIRSEKIGLNSRIFERHRFSPEILATHRL
jgi:integrase